MNIKSFGSICSGVGMQEMAIKKVFPNIEINYFSEIDKYAIKSYKEIHGDIPNLGDFTKAEDIPYVDMMFASTPCQDFSVAGKQAGFDGMRGTLTFEWVKMLERLKIDNKMPKVIGFENVPAIKNKKFIDGFNLFKSQLKELGYNFFVDTLNAKGYGVPQNRNRVFMIGFLDTNWFEFPTSFKLQSRLKDILEGEVEEKYYLSEEKQLSFVKTKKSDDTPHIICQGLLDMKGHDISRRVYNADGISPNVNARSETAKVIIKGNVSPNNFRSMDIMSDKGICKTLMANGGGNTEPKILVKEATKKGYKEAYDGDSINLEQPNSKTRRGRVGSGVANTLTTSCNQGVVSDYRIRKLTPLECWRLMGIDDSNFYKAQAVNSNSQLYKQAGNGIVVNVLVEIFKKIKELQQ